MRTAVTRKRIAQALSVIAEAGFTGFEYKSAVNAVSPKDYASTTARWSPVPNPKFDPSEFRELLAVAARARLIDAGTNTQRIANGEYGVQPWTVHLTLEGWDQIELHDRTILEKWLHNIRDNAPTVFLSALIAVASSWAVYKLGAPKEIHPPIAAESRSNP